MFESKISRISVVVCVTGLAVVAADLSSGHLRGNRPLVATSLEVPGTPVSAIFTHPIGLVHVHRSCEFRSKAMPGQVVFPIKQKWYVFDQRCSVSLDRVLEADRQLFGVNAPGRVDGLTGYDRIVLEMALDMAPNAWLLTGLRMGLLNERLIEKSLGESPVHPSGRGLKILQARAMLAGRIAGLPADDIETVASCIREDLRVCVQTSERTRFTLVDQMKESWSLSAGIALMLIGTAGAFFLSSIKWLWNRTVIKLFNWIRRGD